MRRSMTAAGALILLAACGKSHSPALNFTLRLGDSTVSSGATNRAVSGVMQVMRIRAEGFGVRHPVFAQSGSAQITGFVSGVRDPKRLLGILISRGFVEFRLVDTAGALAAALPGIDRALVAAGILARRATRSPATNSFGQILGAPTDTGPRPPVAGRFAVAAPLSELLFSGPMPGAFTVPQEDVPRVDTLLAQDAARMALPRGLALVWAWPTSPPLSGPVDRALYAVEGEPVLTSEAVTDARASEGSGANGPELRLELSERGAALFQDQTRRLSGRYLAMLLDGAVLGEPAIVRGEIGKHVLVKLGTMSLGDAEDLALILRTGALPAPVRLLEATVDSDH
jgi:preprotein translocase subunit SecD